MGKDASLASEMWERPATKMRRGSAEWSNSGMKVQVRNLRTGNVHVVGLGEGVAERDCAGDGFGVEGGA